MVRKLTRRIRGTNTEVTAHFLEIDRFDFPGDIAGFIEPAFKAQVAHAATLEPAMLENSAGFWQMPGTLPSI